MPGLKLPITGAELCCASSKEPNNPTLLKMFLRESGCCGLMELNGIRDLCGKDIGKFLAEIRQTSRGFVTSTLSSGENKEEDREKLKSHGFTPLDKPFYNPNSGNLVQIWGIRLQPDHWKGTIPDELTFRDPDGDEDDSYCCEECDGPR